MTAVVASADAPTREVTMDSTTSQADPVAELANSFAGQILRPTDPGYEEARRVHNGLIDRHPALIARCRGLADIADAMKLGRDQGLEIAIRGGGHNVAARDDRGRYDDRLVPDEGHPCRSEGAHRPCAGGRH